MAKLMKGMLHMPVAPGPPAVLDGVTPTATVAGPFSSTVPLGHPRARSVPALSPSAAVASAAMAETDASQHTVPVTPAAVFLEGVADSPVGRRPSQSSRASPRSKSLPMFSRVRFSQPDSMKSQEANPTPNTLPSTSILKRPEASTSSRMHHTSPAAFVGSVRADAHDSSCSAEDAHEQSGQGVQRRSKSLASSVEPILPPRLRASASQPLLRDALRSSGGNSPQHAPPLDHSSTAGTFSTPTCQGLIHKKQEATETAAGLSAGTSFSVAKQGGAGYSFFAATLHHDKYTVESAAAKGCVRRSIV